MASIGTEVRILAVLINEVLGIITKILIQRYFQDEPRPDSHLTSSNHETLGILTKIVGAKLR